MLELVLVQVQEPVQQKVLAPEVAVAVLWTVQVPNFVQWTGQLC